MEDILIKIFILKSKSCSYSLPKYKIKSSWEKHDWTNHI